MRLPPLLALLALVALALAACDDPGGDDGPATSGGAAAAVEVIAAGPKPAADDRDDDDLLRVTFSPDRDGTNDRVEVRASAAPGTRLELRIEDLTGAGPVRPTVPVVAGDDGVALLVWDGRDRGAARLPERSYLLDVCVADGGPCAARRVVAHARVLSASIDDLGSFAVGADVPVRIDTDRAGPIRLELVPAHDVASAAALGAVDVAGAGTYAYPVPRVPRGGQWVLRVSTGAVRRFLPLVVRAPGLQLARPPRGTALVVYPVVTWRAYSRADVDRDGRPDSWYRHPDDPYVPRTGPYETARPLPLLLGSEPAADRLRPVSRLLAEEGLRVQAVTDVELARMPPAAIARYPVLVFAGHEEYYEDALYRRVEEYLATGGRALYLQANPFYGEVELDDDRITRLSYRYRTQDRSDYALAANGFRVCCWPESVAVPYRVEAAALERLPWLFRGTGLAAGDPLGRAVDEVDGVDAALSPRGTVIVASGTVPAHREDGDEGVEPAAWVGAQRFPYPPAGLEDQRVDIAYAALPGGGEVFSWGNHGFTQGLYRKAVPAAERAAQRRMLLNIWRRFTR